MNGLFIVIIIVLVFIAYQLYKLNRVKEYELREKAEEKYEQKIKELFPHLYFIESEDIKEEIRDFMAQHMSIDDSDSIVSYIYTERYKEINDKIDAETDLNKKRVLIEVKKSISKELKQWEDKFDKMVDDGKISDWEKSFMLYSFLKAINDQFPERHFELNDYFKSQFRGAHLLKD